MVLSHPHTVNMDDWIKTDTKGLSTRKEVMVGVQHILADMISKDSHTADMLKSLVESNTLMLESSLSRSAAKDKESADKKYQQYHDFKVCMPSMRSHQMLAINRAEQDKILKVKVSVPHHVEARFISQAKRQWIPDKAQDYVKNLISTSIHDAYNRLMEPKICRQSRSQATKKAEKESVDIFSQNLYRLLLTPPVKGKVVLALDPGFTHGCKLAMLSPTGSVLETAVIFPIGRHANLLGAKEKVTVLIISHRCETIAVGNGVGCREAEAFISSLIQDKAFHPLDARYCIVSEDGASIYSASNEAIAELPDLDTSMRGAVSLGRRLQDPLLELVKIEPKHLGIGMYQHDIPDTLLRAALAGVITDCVSFVGADLNVAGISLLKRLAGLNEKKAQAIIDYRTKHKGFVNREQLRLVKGIGDKTYEQCVGFVRVLPATDHRNSRRASDAVVVVSDDEECIAVGTKRKLNTKGKRESKKAKLSKKMAEPNPLDITCIHPESYGTAQRFMDLLGVNSQDIGKPTTKQAISSRLRTQSIKSIAEQLAVGVPTLQLIVDGLRQTTDFDIRAGFEKPLFKKGLTKLEDLHPGTDLTGRVTNVTTFGAFVDCGVGRDGLIHTSRMGGRDVGVGDVVDVRVISLDHSKGHVGLRLESIRSRLSPKMILSTTQEDS